MKKITISFFLCFFFSFLRGYGQYCKVKDLFSVPIPSEIVANPPNENTYPLIKNIAQKFRKEVKDDQGEDYEYSRSGWTITKLDEKCYLLEIYFACNSAMTCGNYYLIDTKPSIKIYKLGGATKYGGDGYLFLKKLGENNYRFYVEGEMAINGRFAGYETLDIMDVNLAMKKIRILRGTYFLNANDKKKSDIILNDVTAYGDPMSANPTGDTVEHWVFHWDGINWSKKKYKPQ